MPPRKVSVITSVTILLCIFVSFAALIAIAYGLLSAPPLYPFVSYRMEWLAVLGTAFISTCFVSWLVFVAKKRTRTFPNLAAVIVAAQASLTIYALLAWKMPSTWMNRSTFFGEYNWLTFVFEVSPAASLIVGCLLFILLWKKPGANNWW